MHTVGFESIINVVRHLLKTTGYVSLKWDNGIVTLDSSHKVLRKIHGQFNYYLDENTVVTATGRITLEEMQEEATHYSWQHPYISNYEQITGQLKDLFNRISAGDLELGDGEGRVFHLTVNKNAVRLQSGFTSRTSYKLEGIHFGKEL